MAEKDQPPQKGIKMGPLDLALYGFILCVHYPLKLTFATYRTSKTAVVQTVSFPKRALNYTTQVITNAKHKAEETISHTLNSGENSNASSDNTGKTSTSSNADYTANTMASTINFARNALKSTINLAKTTTTSVINASLYIPNKAANLAKQATSVTLQLVNNAIYLPINCTKSIILFMGSFVNQAKEEVNHQFETKINEPKLQYQNALNNSVNSIINYSLLNINAIKEGAQALVRKAFTFGHNVSQLGFNFLKQLTEEMNLNEYNDQSSSSSTNAFEKVFQKFQAISFETERQSLNAQIKKLNDELKRRQPVSPSFDKERLKCDKQIHDLQDQLTRIHLSYTQQKQSILSDFEKERLLLKQELKKVNTQLVNSQINFEKLNKEQMGHLNKEDQEALEKFLQSYEELKENLSRCNNTNHNEDNHDDTNSHYENQDVSNTLQEIEFIKKNTLELKKEISQFDGTENNKTYLRLNGQLIHNTIKLHNIDCESNNVIRKNKKQVLKLAQKSRDELKSKV